MVTVTADQVVIDRTDLSALLDVAALARLPITGPPPIRHDVLARCGQALDTPTPHPAWDLISGPIARCTNFEANLTTRHQAQLDQVQARTRQGLDQLGVTITDPAALHEAIAVLAYVRAVAIRGPHTGAITPDEAAGISAVTLGLSAAMCRWLPPEARP